MCSHLLYDGSSPLARGLRCRHSSILLTVRIIPARAGFTTSAPLTSAPGSDHPRSRGVYVLPPLAAIIGVMDHPRSRGVYGGLFTPGRRKAGSSPLARGLRTSSSSPGRGGRIIPARAGFTARPPGTGGAAADHPRSRGVYSSARRVLGSRAGSSPLARGLPVERERARASLRIIPARAGFTPAPTATPPQDEDHPRSRGVYRSPDLTADTKDGSSPLARGLRHSEPVLISRSGIIPARAGFTSRRFCSTGSVWDHPRSRGVYSARS